MIDLRLGTELTWCPRKPHSRWQEFRRKGEAVEVAAELNRLLSKGANRLVGEGSPAPLVAKADVFRAGLGLSEIVQPHEAWCIEVGCKPFSTSTLASNLGTHTVRAFESLYQAASSLDLHPHIERTVRCKGELITLDYPTGGSHLQVAMDFWGMGSETLLKLYLFERAICIDYTNNPTIRWLFAQWSDDLNSQNPVSSKHLKELHHVLKTKAWTPLQVANWVHGQALTCHSINQRFARTGKPHYPTYEFRFFDMARTVEEFRLHVAFLRAWIGYHVARINDEGFTDMWKGDDLTLTPTTLHRLRKHPRFARDSITAFFTRIGLDFNKGYEPFWERGYERRRKWGKMV